MFRELLLLAALVSSTSAYAGGDEDPEMMNLQCFALATGETLALRASPEQLSEFTQISKALGKTASLKVKSARLVTFRYSGNTGNTAILGFELENGLQFEAAADQLDQKSNDYTIEDDGGGYTVVEAGGNRIVLLDKAAARIDVLVTPDQMKEIELETSIVFEGGTGSLTVKDAQSALFVPSPCQ
ncbi:MAG: hypothetical protein V4760_15750 [Bdellovibrionota bacterium]